MARSRVRQGFGLLSLALLAACASTPRLGGDPQLKVAPGTELPAPGGEDLTAEARAYYVGPFDKLGIDVFGIAELSGREVQVNEKGQIFFPPAGTMQVAGMTLSEIQALMAQRLRASHVRYPQVTVSLKEAKSQLLTIEGEVRSPGIYPVTGRMTLLRAMAVSGGVTDLAKLQDLVIFRTVKGQRYAALYNLKSIRHGVTPDPEVYANDIVVVGDSQSRRFIKDMIALSPLLTTPILLINNLTN